MTKIRIGTRKSKFALAQTQLVVDDIKKMHPEIEIEVVTEVIGGDQIIDKPQ